MNISSLDKKVDPVVLGDVIMKDIKKEDTFKEFIEEKDNLRQYDGELISIRKRQSKSNVGIIKEGEAHPGGKIETEEVITRVDKYGEKYVITDRDINREGEDIVDEAKEYLKAHILQMRAMRFISLLIKDAKIEEKIDSINYKNLLKVRKKIGNKQGVLFVTPEQYGQLLLDENFISNDVTGKEILVDGYVGRVAGFKVKVIGEYGSDLYLPVISNDVQNLIIMDKPVQRYRKRDLGSFKKLDEDRGQLEIGINETTAEALVDDEAVILLKTKATGEDVAENLTQDEANEQFFKVYLDEEKVFNKPVSKE